MDYIVLIIWGVVIGLIAAIPIGPVNLICIRRTLQGGSLTGFISGLGAAVGDGLFAAVTGFGLTAIRQLIAGYSVILQLIGGLLLLTIGIRTFYAPPPPRFTESLSATNGGAKAKMSPVRAIASTFALTITNPATLIWFSAWFASATALAGDSPTFLEAAFVVAGVFAGSATWWLTLTTGVGLLHARIDDKIVRRINEASGVLVVLFGIGVLGHLIWVHIFR
ncbi:MAG: LysE family transporter [Alphaproteobacteria bacterium]|nr:LysE family transporter [Alphaproteobacteria bacterium]